LLEASVDRRRLTDRRAVSRGGRRPYDRPGRYPNLLIADSYDGARVPCARYLDHFGFQVDQAVDAESAAAAMQNRQPHVLLVEASLPKTYESGLAEWLEATGVRQIPVIVMLSDFDGGEKLLPATASMLVKPFPLLAMLQEVRRAIRMLPAI
jgi:DNA-binding response OmpR family regulator